MAVYEVRNLDGQIDTITADRVSLDGGRLTFYDADGNPVAGYAMFTNFRLTT